MANKENNKIESEEYNHRTDCGWFSWRPSCLNCCNSPPCLLFLICLHALLYGITGNGFTNVAITSIERRFELPSSRSGLIPPTYDIVAAFAIVVVSFLGSHGSKPRWLASGLVILGVGSIVFTLPHFLAGTYQYEQENSTGLCPEHNATKCGTGENSISALSKYFYVFILAQILFGFGAPVSYSLGVTFIDESVPSKSSGLYLGILSACTIIGPAFGYMIGSIFLNFFTDFLTVDTSTLKIDTSSPQWVGAWWLGYLFAAVLMFIAAIPLSCLPPELKGTRAIQEQRISQAHRNSEAADKDVSRSKKGSGVKWKDLPRVLKSLFTNPTFMLVMISSVADSLFIGGSQVFLPKYLETQYGLTASFAALQTGIYLVVFGGGGLITTGWLIKRLNLKVWGMLKFSLVTSFICMLSMFGLFLSCDEIPLAGVSVPYFENNTTTSTDVSLELQSDCNVNCLCRTEQFIPVCGIHNNIAYFSPCHAGCTTYDEESKEYSNCTCIAETIADDSSATSILGICVGQCWQYYLYSALLAVTTCTLLMNGTLIVNTVLRCVPDHSRDYALGIYGFFVRTLGSFIGPILFGTLIDKACILWHEECGERGRCWAYDRSKIALYMLLIGVIIKAFTVVFYCLALCTYKPPIDGDVPKGLTNNGFNKDEA